MKKNIFILMLVSALSAVSMSMMACGQTSKGRVETEVAAPEPKVDVRVVVATSDEGMTIYQSPSKSALKLVCTGAFSHGMMYDWGKEVPTDDEELDEFQTHSMLRVIDEQDGWYKVVFQGLSGYISKDEGKEVKVIPVTEAILKRKMEDFQQIDDGFGGSSPFSQQTVDEVTYFLSWEEPDDWDGISFNTPVMKIWKIEEGKALSGGVYYKMNTRTKTLTFFEDYDWNTQKIRDPKVVLTDSRYCKNGERGKLTPEDLKKVLSVFGKEWPNVKVAVEVDGETVLFDITEESSLGMPME